ncbi:MAG: hypothetical protein J6S64_02300, partial [Bacteroidales bacterium]|nr:hypothetical protein [Bacteroidales bacterium]
MAAVALFAVGCNKEYDDSALVKKVNDLEGRVSALESLNTTVSGISALVSALNEKNYVKGVIEVKDGRDSVIGYSIVFEHGQPVTIYNGAKGDTGAQGPQGEVGPTGP